MLAAREIDDAAIDVVKTAERQAVLHESVVAAEGDKIAFTGSTLAGRAIREATAGTGKALTLELGGKSPYIVFEGLTIADPQTLEPRPGQAYRWDISDDGIVYTFHLRPGLV